MRVVAVVPVKTHSERVLSKNFKPFHGEKSLFKLKLEQLNGSGAFDKIYVSSDNLTLADCADQIGYDFLERDVAFCNNNVPWSSVIERVARDLPEDPETVVAWCHTTSPLFSSYANALEQYTRAISDGFDGLVSVKRIQEFLISEHGLPINYGWGPWHKYSQHLPKTYAVNGALFMTTKATMITNKYVISSNPFFWETSDKESLDVDTELDFAVAQFMMELNNEAL